MYGDLYFFCPGFLQKKDAFGGWKTLLGPVMRHVYKFAPFGSFSAPLVLPLPFGVVSRDPFRTWRVQKEAASAARRTDLTTTDR